MKIFIVSFFAYMLIFNVSGAIYNIGDQEIHFENGIYFKIYLSDTFRIDTTTFMIKYYSGTEGGVISTIENNNGLVRKHEFITEYISYNYNNGMDFISMCTNLSNETDIEVLELNCEVKYLCDPMIPDDDEYGQQWYLDTIKAPLAWNITTGDEDVVVGILDTGFYWEHDDLGPGSDGYESSYLNPYEDAWSTWNDPCTGDKIDGDQVPNYTNKPDDWKGWSAERDIDCDPEILENDTREYDRDYLIANYVNGESLLRHGTFIAGIIGGKTNNGTDIAGIAGGWGDKGVSLLYVQTGVNDHPPGTLTEQVVDAIEYCIMHGGQWDEEVNVIQMAFSTDENQNMKSMLDIAYNQGIFLVAAAGNEYGSNVVFPANWNNVFAVGATGIDDYVMPVSNYGNELDLCAPGEDILGIIPFHTAYPNTFDLIQGRTSAASAMVSGTIALMLSVNPDLTNTEIKEILHESADKVHPEEYGYENGWCEEIGYGRLNTYRAVCMALEYIEMDEEVQINTVWTEPKSFLNNLIISSGAKLTVCSEIKLGPDSRLIVEPGATLEINGGLFTNLNCCGYEDMLWKGVEIWGDRNKHQFICQGEIHQGKIVIKNGGTIENAEIGVLLGARDLESEGDFDETKTGGIIQVPYGGNPEEYDANFINNKWAVRFLKYQNYTYDPFNCNNLSPYENLSYFNNCYFNINSNYQGGTWSYSHVHLSEVNGINFGFCTFENNKYNEPKGHGINAYRSGFRIYEICDAHISPCPEPYQNRSKFYNFYKAVNLLNSGIYTIYIKNTDFFDNSYGVKLIDVDFATIVNCDFEVGYNSEEEGKCDGTTNSYGIYMDECTGFAIEDNDFAKTAGAPEGTYFGIWVSNTEAQDEIYRNTFHDFNYANLAIGRNWGDAYFLGLQYLCNHNDLNYKDFLVIRDEFDIGGIQSEQGTLEEPAGNVFSPSPPGTGDFFNLGNFNIDYYFWEDDQNQEPVLITGVDPISVEPENTCPSHYGGGSGEEERGVVLTPGQIQESEQEFAAGLSDYNNVNVLYENLVDGGNTEATLTDVETAWPGDMWELRAELLGKSPHLSMDVLKAAADKTEVLPESVIFEIMAANPDELKKEELLTYLEEKEEPLPAYMIDILSQLTGNVTYKTILQQQLAKHGWKKSRAAYDIIRSQLNDTLMEFTELRNWLDNLASQRADEQIIESYIAEGNYTDALALANLVPSLYELEGDDLAEYNYYMDMLGTTINLLQEGRNIFELDSTEFSSVVYIAENSNGLAGTQAKNILEFAYGFEYCNCPDISDTTGLKSSAVNMDSFSKVTGVTLTVEPNPARQWTAFNYSLPETNSTGEIKISDVSGKVIETLTITGKQGQKIWDTRKINSGVYFYTLIIDGISEKGKLVVSK